MTNVETAGRSRRGTLLLVVAATVTVVLVAAMSLVARAWGGTAEADRATGPDPTAPGPHPVASVDYHLGDTAFPLKGFRIELTGAVHYPADLGDGARPMVLMAHGLFATCADRLAGAAWADARDKLYGRNPTEDPAEQERLRKIMDEADEQLGRWPCAPGVAPVPSHRGYDYLARQLASHGFVVVSIGANGINAGSSEGADDFPVRAALMNQHLAMWQQLAASGAGPLAGRFVEAGSGAPSEVDFAGRVDLTNVGTLGHSRGGRGAMNHAADEHRDQWPAGVRVNAVVPLQPVIFGGDDLVTRIPFATVIGACDIVSNPSSRDYFDRAKGENTARIHQFFVHGANHSFFNTQWSPSGGQVTAGDDANSNVEAPFPAPGHCRTTSAPVTDEKQLTEDEQRRVGVGYISAFFRRYLAGETAFDALLTGAEHPLGAVDVEFADPVR